MNYEQMASMGACGPAGCYPQVGGAYGAGLYGGNAIQYDIMGRGPVMMQQPVVYQQPQVAGSLINWDIVGQAATTPPDESFLQKSSVLGIKNWHLLAGAAAIGATWFAYSRGYLGGEPARGRDFGGDFFF